MSLTILVDPFRTKTWIEWLEYICISIFLLVKIFLKLHIADCCCCGVNLVSFVRPLQAEICSWHEFWWWQELIVGEGLTLSTRILAHPHPHPGYIWSWWAHNSKYFSINTKKTVTTCGKLFSLSTLHFRPHHRVTTIDRLKALVSRWGNSDEGEVINHMWSTYSISSCPALPCPPPPLSPLSSLLPPPTNHS